MGEFVSIKKILNSQTPMKSREWYVFKSLLKTFAFKKHEIITAQNKVERFLYFIEEGAVRLYQLLPNGREISIGFRLDGQFVSSYASFLTQQPSPVILQAIEKSKLYGIKFNDLQQLYNLSKTSERLGRLNAEELFTEIETHRVSLITKTSYELYEQLLNKRKTWLQRIPQKYLASYINVTPETYSRIRKKFSF